MNYVSRILKRFGGLRPMARAGNWPHTTVQSWVTAGVIPARRQQEVIEAGRKVDVEIVPADFFDAAPTPKRKADKPMRKAS